MSKSQMGIDEIVDTLLMEMSAEDRHYMKTLKGTQLHYMHHGYGTHIRNTFGLWIDNPLTEKWRTDESSRDIRGGVDYSADHPDSISMQIIDKLHQKLKNEKTN